jgi:transcriptional regulator with XRE-family HTH domain
MQIDDEKLFKEIGRRLKMLRVKSGIKSYETFAVNNDLDRKYYWSVEKGRNITIQYLNKILSIHNVTFEDFFKYL